MEDRLKQDRLIVRQLLFPGEWLCDRFNIENNDNRMLLRMYLNLVIYAKVFGTLAYLFAHS